MASRQQFFARPVSRFAVGLVASAGLVLGANAVFASPDKAPQANVSTIQTPHVLEARSLPCPDAVKTPVSQLTTLATNFDILLPSAAQAGRLLRSYWCASGPSAVLEFASGITIRLRNADMLGDPATYWNTRVSQGDGHLAPLFPVPALVTPLRSDAEGLGSVQWVGTGNTFVSLVGNGTLATTVLVTIGLTLTVA